MLQKLKKYLKFSNIVHFLPINTISLFVLVCKRWNLTKIGGGWEGRGGCMVYAVPQPSGFYGADVLRIIMFNSW